MLFEIDVSGQDILSGNFAVAVANTQDIIYGFRFDEEVLHKIKNAYDNKKYRYKKSGFFKTRIYCVIIYYVFREILRRYPHILKDEIILNICNDLDSHQNDIQSNLNFLLSSRLGIKISKINWCKLGNDSSAHKYAYIFRKDTRKAYPCFVSITLNEFEIFLARK